ncbi:MAG: hypothetical protein ACK4N5_22005, partial [Myxococcales bacterium]
VLWWLEGPASPRADPRYTLTRGYTPASPLRVGDRVEIRLRLRATAATGPVVVEDPVPAGIAPIVHEGADEPFVAHDERARRVVRRDRVAFLLPELKEGETVLTWHGVATVAGDFAAPPPVLRLDQLRSAGSPDRLRIEQGDTR